MKKRILFLMLVAVMCLQSLGILTITAATETTAAETQQLLCTTSSGNNNIKAMDNYSVNLKTDGGNQSLYLYYGSVSGTQTALTTGTLTSSANAILSVEKKNNETQWRIYPKKCGTATLTYTDGTVTYTGTVTVVLPSTGFFTAQEHTEANFISAYTLPPNTDTTLWLMKESGFNKTEAEGLSLKLSNNNTYYEVTSGVKVLTAVPREDNPTKYDIKLTIAGDELATDEGYQLSTSSNKTIRLYYNSGTKNVSISLKLEEIPKLMYRKMGGLNGTYTESTGKPQPIDSLIYGSTSRIRFYYGTSSSYVPVTAVRILSGTAITAETATAADGGIFWKLKSSGMGQSVIQYTYMEAGATKTGTATLQVTLPQTALFTERERTEAAYCESPVSWFTLSEASIWLLCEQGYTETEKNQITVSATDRSTSASVSGITMKWEERSATPGVFDLMITLPKPSTMLGYKLHIKKGSSNLLDINIELQNNALPFGDDIVIGFTKTSPAALGDETIFQIIEHGATSIGYSTSYPPSNEYAEYTPGFLGNGLAILAAERKKDTTGATFYEIIDNKSASIKVTKFYLDPFEGNNETFSLSKTKYVSEISGEFTSANWPKLYFKLGVTARACVCAEVEATVNGQSVYGTVRMMVYTTYQPTTEYDCTVLNILTMDDLQKLLNDIAATMDPQPKENVYHNIKLAEKDYIGTLTIPSAFGNSRNRLVIDGQEGGTTRLIGEVDLNLTNAQLRGITFIASEHTDNRELRAVYNGMGQVHDSVFYGYDVALDTTELGLIESYGNVFINNEIALRVDVEGMPITGRSAVVVLTGNTFLNNGTAVQILSLNMLYSPYNFRIYDSNFVGNGTDIDARSGGTLYLYRNYFGEYKKVGNGHIPTPGRPGHDKHNGPEDLRIAMLLAAKTEEKVGAMLHHCPPKIHTENKTKVVTNPRWKYPVLNWWTGEPLETLLAARQKSLFSALLALSEAESETYQNILIADWELDTVIDNTEANSLIIDDSAFDSDTEAEKQIDVIDSDENALGTWIFD